MKTNPTTLFLAFMLLTLLIVGGYLLLSDPFAGTAQKGVHQFSQPQNQNQGAMVFYLQKCASCHGARGEGKGGNPSLQNTPFTEAQIQEIIKNGRGEMPAFPELSPEELKQLSRLIKQF
ncbi:c-type cytochrome [Calditrichota bacterium GD2]